MNQVINYPVVLAALCFLGLWLSAWVGAIFLRTKRDMTGGVREDFNTILLTTLTLNGLIIGFTFSMAISRYEQRKGYEEAEANAIGTEYTRADLLPAEESVKVRSLLVHYLEQRILFYTASGDSELRQINGRTAQLQADLWSAVRDAGVARPTPLVALAVAGMNDVLNSQGYTQAAWWNRIPVSAWLLMMAIGVIGNVLVGCGTANIKAEGVLLTVLPLVLSIAFLLIADIESPRSGFIRVVPSNLSSLAESLRAPGSAAAALGSSQR
jgi:hypothetical protein